METEQKKEYQQLLQEFSGVAGAFAKAREIQFQKEKEAALMASDNALLTELRILEKDPNGLPKQPSKQMQDLQRQATELGQNIKAYNGPVRVYSSQGNQTSHFTSGKEAAKK